MRFTHCYVNCDEVFYYGIVTLVIIFKRKIAVKIIRNKSNLNRLKFRRKNSEDIFYKRNKKDTTAP